HATTSTKNEDSTTLSCPIHQPCTTALASHNPITLKCEDQPKNAAVYWQYLDTSQPHARPHKILNLMSRSEIVAGNLKLLSPRIQDTGIYTCREKGNYLAYYELDFQDSENIYISHVVLGNKVLPNTSIDLGPVGTAEVFTVWSSWQTCDRCGTLGERKKVGFCYMEISKNVTVKEDPRPCGLVNHGQAQFSHAPELRIEMCHEACTETSSMEDENLAIVLVNYQTYLHADILLQCPSSSIYKPVSWKHGNTSFMHLHQMMNNASYVLDKKTGGGSLFIPLLNKSDEGIYRCYVEHRMVGRFHVIFANIDGSSAPQYYSIPESIVLGLSLFLLVLLCFSILQQCKGNDRRMMH
ncbi:hypothetical protein GDO81_019554, partial [Engystomops pustulosus]